MRNPPLLLFPVQSLGLLLLVMSQRAMISASGSLCTHLVVVFDMLTFNKSSTLAGSQKQSLSFQQAANRGLNMTFTGGLESLNLVILIITMSPM